MLHHVACTSAPNGVRVLGVFDTSAKAAAACTERTDFHYPVTLNASFRDLGEDVARLTPITYPNIESEVEGRALLSAL